MKVGVLFKHLRFKFLCQIFCSYHDARDDRILKIKNVRGKVLLDFIGGDSLRKLLPQQAIFQAGFPGIDRNMFAMQPLI